MVATSLKPRAEVFASPPAIVPYPPDFGSYQDEVIGNPILLRAFLNSAIIASGATLVTLVIAVPATYALARLRLRFAGSARFVTILAQMLPAIVVATPLFVLFSRVGLVNSYLGIILAVATITIPFALVILRPFFLAIPTELDDAASVDGCNVFQTFLHVGLPLVRPGLATVAAFTFLLAWGEFVFALVLLQQQSLQPLTVLLNTLIGQYGTRWDHLMAVATVIGLPIVIVFIALQRLIVGGLTAGAMKD
ncbi:carbohydrate ABC transporter permease [Jiangella aurantiaca]|uniref:Carbohydrate ABC transporter permease n=2 Tax=Jiangella aurantiaca TaxID=2530373 RepID=A0A4R5A3X3_9ACTN|nr:carbohydrate ABC transporter permease [Jiangella aurantiaca]